VSRSLALAASLAAIAIASPAFAGPPAQEPRRRISIGAALSDDGRTIEGEVRLRVVNDTGAPLGSIPLWLYPNRFADPEAQVDDRTSHWLYPRGASAGGIEISAPAWDDRALPEGAITWEETPAQVRPKGAKRVLARVALPGPLAPGAQGELHLAFRTEIPERRGRFGRYGGTVALGGDFFPRALADLTGRAIESPPDRASFTVRLSIPAGYGAVIHDEVFPIAGARRTLSVDVDTDVLVAVAMERMEVATARLPFGEAVYVSARLRPSRFSYRDTRRPDDRGVPSNLPSVKSVDFAERAFGVLGTCASLLAAESPGAPLPDRVVLVEIPAFDRLASWGPGNVLVSDRLWGLIPFERALAFHDIALAGELGAALAARATEGERPERRFLAAELVGAHVRALYVAAAKGEAETLKDVVGFAAFVPYVDNLLYAPEVPFREAYAASPEEEDALRDAPWLCTNALPRGRRILAKLEDRLGAEGAAALAASYAGSSVPLDDALAAGLGDWAPRFFADWFGAYPAVNYRIAAARDVPLGSGRVRHEVVVARDGADVAEPVAVRIRDDAGAVGDARWDGEGRSGTVAWDSRAKLDGVHLDPEGRLVEAAGLSDEHPLEDDLQPLPWRPPLLTRLLLWGDTETFEPNVQVAIALRRRYDVTNSLSISGAYAPRGYGGALGYYRSFGRKRTLNARTWYAGPSVGVSRAEETETAGAGIPDDAKFAATMGSVGAMIGRDGRTYFPDPRAGTAFSAYAGYGFGRADGGGFVQDGEVDLRVFGLLSPRIGHVFALYGGAAAVFGTPPAADLATLSNRMMLRGFEIDETYGRLGLYAVIEYRHDLLDLRGARTPLSSTFERLQGALFAGGGTMSLPSGYGGMFTPERLFAEVGYGLRLHMLAFGVSQYLLALDLAVPLWPTERSYEVEQSDGSTAKAARSPFKIVFGITQTY
jgi:hypothetical protein